VAHNGEQNLLLTTSLQPAFRPVILPGLVPWRVRANGSSFVIVHGTSISSSWPEWLFILIIVFCLKKPNSISNLSVLKDSVRRMEVLSHLYPLASDDLICFS